MPMTNPFINLGSSYGAGKTIFYGSPSPFTRFTGNPHSAMEDYRAAGYWHLGIKEPV